MRFRTLRRGSSSPSPAEELAAITAERDQLQTEIADLQDRLLRSRLSSKTTAGAWTAPFRILQYAGTEVVSRGSAGSG